MLELMTPEFLDLTVGIVLISAIVGSLAFYEARTTNEPLRRARSRSLACGGVPPHAVDALTSVFVAFDGHRCSTPLSPRLSRTPLMPTLTEEDNTEDYHPIQQAVTTVSPVGIAAPSPLRIASLASLEAFASSIELQLTGATKVISGDDRTQTSTDSSGESSFDLEDDFSEVFDSSDETIEEDSDDDAVPTGALEHDARCDSHSPSTERDEGQPADASLPSKVFGMRRRTLCATRDHKHGIRGRTASVDVS